MKRTFEAPALRQAATLQSLTLGAPLSGQFDQ